MEDVDVDGAVARFEGRGVEPVELRRVAVAALAAAQAALTGADADRYAIVHVVSALKERVREGGWNPPQPPQATAARNTQLLPVRPSAVLRVDGSPQPPS